MTLTIEIEDTKRKSLEKIATERGMPVSKIIKDIVDDYLHRNVVENKETIGLMKLSETSFSEWDNEEDAVYDKL